MSSRTLYNPQNYVVLESILDTYQDTAENFFKKNLAKLPEKRQESLEEFLKTCPLTFPTKRGNIFLA